MTTGRESSSTALAGRITPVLSNASPLFLREGTVLPFGPVMQHVEERDPLTELALVVCPGPGGEVSCDLEDERTIYRIGAALHEGEPEATTDPALNNNLRVTLPGPEVLQDAPKGI